MESTGRLHGDEAAAVAYERQCQTKVEEIDTQTCKPRPSLPTPWHLQSLGTVRGGPEGRENGGSEADRGRGSTRAESDSVLSRPPPRPCPTVTT